MGREQKLVPQVSAATAAGETTSQEGAPPSSWLPQEQQQAHVPCKQVAADDGVGEIAQQQQQQQQQGEQEQQQQQQDKQQEQRSSLDLDDGLFDLDSA